MSAADPQRAITAGRLSIMALWSARASSYPGSSGRITSPPSLVRSSSVCGCEAHARISSCSVWQVMMPRRYEPRRSHVMTTTRHFRGVRTIVRSDYRPATGGTVTLRTMAQWVPPPLPAELIARRRGPLVGRAAELAAFEQAWERVEGGNRQAVFIGGEPGAGKTRLAAEVASTLVDHGVAVLVGSSTADADVPVRTVRRGAGSSADRPLHRVRWRTRWRTRDHSCGG